MLFNYLLDTQFGLVNYLLGFVGIGPIGWIQTQPWAWIALVGMTVWWTLGFNTIIYLAGLGTSPATSTRPPNSTAPAAWGKFRYVTVPGLRTVLVFVITTTILASANMFGQSYLVTKGGPGDSTRTAIMVMTEQGLRQFKMGTASAMSYVLALCPGCHIHHQLRAAEGEKVMSQATAEATTPSPAPPARRRKSRRNRNGPVFWIGMVVLAGDLHRPDPVDVSDGVQDPERVAHRPADPDPERGHVAGLPSSSSPRRRTRSSSGR